MLNLPRSVSSSSPINRSAPLNRNLVAWWINLPGSPKGRFFWDLDRLYPAQYNTNMTGASVYSDVNRPGGYGSYFFNGTDQWMEVVDKTTFNGGQSQMTWAAWLRPTVSDTSQRSWIMQGNFSTVDQWAYALQWTPTFGNVRTFIATGSDPGNNYYDTTSGGVVANEWQHIIVVFDGTQATASNRIKVYRNGILMTGTMGGTLPTTIKDSASSNPLHFGTFNGLGRWFQGNMDDIRIYHDALSAENAWRLYDAGRKGYKTELNQRQNFRFFLMPTGGAGGGASESLAATVDAVSTVTGSIQVARSLAAVSAGVSTAAGDIDVSRTLAATSAGVSTVVGAMNVARALAATSNAVSTVAGNLLVTKTLAATSAGVSAVSGNMIVARQLSATSAGVSTVSGSITRSLACAGTIAGVASVTGNLIVARQLATTVAGVSTVAGALSNIKTLAATVAAVSTTSGDIDVARKLAAASNGVSTVAGAMSVTRSLAATSAGVSTVSGAIVVSRSLATACAGVSTVSGTLNTDTDVALATTVGGVSSVSGAMNVARSLSAASAGVSGVSGNTNISKTLAATSAGVSAVSGNILVARSLAAQVGGVSSLTGSLITGETPVAAVVAGVSSVSGAMNVGRKLAAVVAGASSVSGAVNLSRKVSTVVAGVSGVSGTIKVARKLSSVSAGVSGVSGDLTVTGDSENPYETLVLNTQSGSILGFWRLNEGVSATVAVDSSPAGQDSVALNGISFGNPSLLGGDDTNECALFPGTSSGYIRLENNVNSGPLRASQFTITGWFKMPTGTFGTATSTGTGGISAIPLVTKGRSETDTVGFNVNYFMGISTNKLAGDFESGGGTNHPITGGTTLIAGRWYFGAITYDGANFRLYLNGVSDASPIATSDAPDITTAQPACIGSAMTTAAIAAGGFNGYIDEVAIWGTALSSSQILALWETGRVTKGLSAVCSGVSGVSGGVLISSGLVDIEDFNLSSDRVGNFGLVHSTNKTFNVVRVGGKTFNLRK